MPTSAQVVEEMIIEKFSELFGEPVLFPLSDSIKENSDFSRIWKDQDSIIKCWEYNRKTFVLMWEKLHKTSTSDK